MYVTDKEVTLKSDRFASLENNHIAIQYKTLASAMLPIHIWHYVCLLWSYVYYCIVGRSGGINVCINWNSVYIMMYMLQWMFLPDPACRAHMTMPVITTIDYHAACFCHHKMVDVGHVCSVCLSSKFVCDVCETALYTWVCNTVCMFSILVLSFITYCMYFLENWIVSVTVN